MERNSANGRRLSSSSLQRDDSSVVLSSSSALFSLSLFLNIFYRKLFRQLRSRACFRDIAPRECFILLLPSDPVDSVIASLLSKRLRTRWVTRDLSLRKLQSRKRDRERRMIERRMAFREKSSILEDLRANYTIRDFKNLGWSSRCLLCPFRFGLSLDDPVNFFSLSLSFSLFSFSTVCSTW